MKALLPQLVIVAVCVCIAACSKREAEPEQAEAVSTTPPPAATPAPVKAEIAIATPPPKRLAPDGMFFLLTKKSVETPDGIVGLKPGTQVLRQPDGKFLADGHVLELLPTEMTNDLDLAGRIVGADARAQAAIRQTLQAQPRSTPVANGASPTRSAAPSGSTPATAAAPVNPTIPGTQRSGGTGVESSTTLGSAHTRVQGGWIYEKDAQGNWVKSRLAR